MNLTRTEFHPWKISNKKILARIVLLFVHAKSGMYNSDIAIDQHKVNFALKWAWTWIDGLDSTVVFAKLVSKYLERFKIR